MGRAGYIYLMYADTGHFKIGTSVRPNERLRAFKTGIPANVHIFYTFPTDDMQTAEWHLHQMFAAKRYKREWFDLDDDDVVFICGIYQFSSELQDFEYHASTSEKDDSKRIVQLLEHAARHSSQFTDEHSGEPLMKMNHLRLLFQMSLLKQQLDINLNHEDLSKYSRHININYVRFEVALSEVINNNQLVNLGSEIGLGFNRFLVWRAYE